MNAKCLTLGVFLWQFNKLYFTQHYTLSVPSKQQK